jgi:Beta protein
VTRYVPVLKGRQGELNALAQVQLATRREMLPLLEVVPADPTDPLGVVDDCRKAVEKLAKSWQEPVLLDGGLLDLSLDLQGNARGPLWELTEHARAALLPAVPVLRLADDVLARTDAAAACEQDGNGVCVRLVEQDLDEEPDDLELALDDLLRQVGITRTNTDLVLDAGAVDGDLAVRGVARIVRSLLRELASAQDWRSVTVIAGAFPEDLSAFQPWVIGRRPRFDAALYDQIMSKRLPRVPGYGDYAAAHPLLTTGQPFASLPQLRYTAASDWLVLKGRRNDPRGHNQFFDICDAISEQPEFAGPGLGTADTRIAAPRSYGPGNWSTWSQVSTTHHLDLVVSRLATLGEP